MTKPGEENTEAQPDTDSTRLVRIETRLVKYQQANAIALEALAKSVATLAEQQALLIKLLTQPQQGGDEHG